jgi:NTE family protein
MWKEIAKKPVFTNIDQYADDYILQLTKESVLNNGIDISPLMDIVKSYVDEDIVRQTDKELIISTFNISQREQKYFELNEIPHGQLLNYAMASSRLPFFKNVIIDNHKYLDGGMGDNLPYYSKLDDKHFDLVITIKISQIPYFLPLVSIKNITYDNSLTITPSKRIGNPLEFKKPSFDEKFEMGYFDTKIALKKFLDSIGHPT